MIHWLEVREREREREREVKEKKRKVEKRDELHKGLTSTSIKKFSGGFINQEPLISCEGVLEVDERWKWMRNKMKKCERGMRVGKVRERKEKICECMQDTTGVTVWLSDLLIIILWLPIWGKGKEGKKRKKKMKMKQWRPLVKWIFICGPQRACDLNWCG